MAQRTARRIEFRVGIVSETATPPHHQ